MRKVSQALMLVLALAGSAAPLMAQQPPDTARRLSAAVRVSSTTASVAALTRVRQDLHLGLVHGWSRALESRLLVVSNDLQVRDNRGLYVVAVSCPRARGHVRVLVDATSGETLSALYNPAGWGDAPDWWRRGLDRAPR